MFDTFKQFNRFVIMSVTINRNNENSELNKEKLTEDGSRSDIAIEK